MPLITYRAKRINSDEWVYGYYAYKKLMNKYFILREEMIPYSTQTIFEEIEVQPDTYEQWHE